MESRKQDALGLAVALCAMMAVSCASPQGTSHPDASTSDPGSQQQELPAQDVFTGWDQASTPDQDPADTQPDEGDSLPAAELSLSSVTPGSGPPEGMTAVTLEGSGFLPGAQVMFGEELAMYVFVLSDGIINCTAPPHEPGRVDVRVLLPDGREAALDEGYEYRGALALASVEPGSGPPEGGTPVTIRGSGLADGPIFLFGGSAAVGVEIADDETAFAVTPPHDPGTVSLVAVSPGDQASMKAAFTYGPKVVKPGASGFAVTACKPGSGPPAGGSVVYLSGTGFADGNTVRIGALPATGVKVLGDTLIRAVTPQGSPGPADVVVGAGNVEARLDGGFEYLPDGPAVLAVDPPIGSWAGGTRVRVYGFGLQGVEHVFFGGREGVDLVRDSSIRLTVTAPRSEEIGYVPLTVFGGGASMSGPAYYYFDPSLSGGGTWGGPVDGAVNVTVMSLGHPLPDAYVVLGHDAHTPWQGTTDDRGQLTFSEPGMSGRTSVTATKQGYTAYTVGDFDAANVTVYVSPADTPEPTGLPPGYGTKECVVSGRVLDYDKYFIKPPWVEGDVWVQCGTSSSSMFGGTPDPGPGAIVDDHGRFEIVTRVGQFAVICALMTHDDAIYRDVPLRIGAAPHVKCPQPGEVTGVEVTLGIETDAELWVAPNAGGLSGGEPNGPNFLGGFDLGSDGYLDILRNVVKETPSRARFLYQPRSFVGPIDGDGYSFYTTVSSKTGNGMPYGVTLAFEVPPPDSWPVLVGDDAGLVEVPTTLRRAITALMPTADGVVLAADTGGGTYWFNGKDFYHAQVDTHRSINALWGSGLDSFWAVGDGGAVWRVHGKQAEPIPTGITEDLTGVWGLSDENLHVAGGSFLMWWDGLSFQPLNVPNGVKLSRVRSFSDGMLVAIGNEGSLIEGPIGGSLGFTKVADADLHGMDGPLASDLWIAGSDGTLLHRTGDSTVEYDAPTENDLRGVIYRGPCDVLAYGDAGTVYAFDCEGFTDLSRPDANLDILAGAMFGDAPVLAGRHYVELPPFIGFADITSPAEGSNWDGTRLAFGFPEGQEISHHQAILSGPDGKAFWVMTINGAAREQLLPDLEAVSGYTPVPPGYKRMNLTSAFSPDFDIDGYTSSNLNYYRRQSFTTNLVSFQ